MKNSIKYLLIVAMVLIGATLLVSGNAGAVIVAPQPGTTIIGTMPVVSPVFGSGVVPGAVLTPKPFIGQPFGQPFFPFFRPFFPFFNPFNPFFNVDVDPFIGVGVNPGFVD
jgi:hypothetical protein